MDTASRIDLIAALGQVIGALFTAAAVVVALYIASRDRRARLASDRARSKAQARQIYVQYGSLSKPREIRGRTVPWTLGVMVRNLSDSAILDVVLEGWATRQASEQAEVGRYIAKGLVSPGIGIDAELQFDGTEEVEKFEPRGWRVCWTDGGGVRWAAGGTSDGRTPPTGEGYFKGTPRREPIRLTSRSRTRFEWPH